MSERWMRPPTSLGCVRGSDAKCISLHGLDPLKTSRPLRVASFTKLAPMP